MKKIYALLVLSVLHYSLYAQCWQSVSAGMDHTVAIKSDGTLWAWGFNGSGQLGDGTTTLQQVPVQIGNSEWIAVSAGGNSTLAIKADGTLWAWGDNLWGQIGDGTFGTIKKSPVKIGTAANWKSVSAGRTFSLAIKTDGTLWAWGDNFDGQLGFGLAPSMVPKQVGTGTDWKSVAAGGSHTVALKNDNTLWVWGQNLYGQLGDGTTTNKSTPLKIGSAEWQSVDAGFDHTVAIKTDGSLWTWGYNDRGQVGDGTFVMKSVPVKIGTSGWKSVSAGDSNSSAINNNGTLWAWGYKIGDIVFGEDESRTSPAQLGTASDWASVILGDQHAFVFSTNGALSGWGDNTWGKLGDDSWVDQKTPKLLSTAAPQGEASQVLCAGETISSLQATGSNVKWYTTASGGVALAGNTPLISGTHYFASQTNASCESESRLEVVVTLNTTPTLPPTGSAAQILCGSPMVADLVPGGNKIKWYLGATGGTPLASTTPLTNGLHYYASQTENGCESSSRFDVTVTLNSTQTPTGNSTQTLCVGSIVSDLNATGTGIKWYTSPSGGVALPGNAVLTNSAHYYGTQTISSLESCSRLDVFVTINSTPTATPTGSATQAFCNAATIANLAATGSNVKWYSVASGGSALSSPAALVNGTHYFASQTVSACESSGRFEVTAIINTIPSPPPTGAAAQQVCVGSTFANLQTTGSEIKWYAASSGGSPLSNSTTLANGTHYFASQTISGCESAARLEVTVSVNTTPTTPAVFQGDQGWRMVDAGNLHTLAIKADGTLWAWGDNFAGSLGDGSNDGERNVPTQIGTDHDWQFISAGESNSIGIKTNGTLWVWGMKWQSVDNTAALTVPTQLGTASNWQTASAGKEHGIAVKKDGTLWAWGYNEYGVIGDGTTTNRANPVQIGTDANWKSVSAAYFGSYAIKTDGTLWAWGNNSQGQLGNGTTTNSKIPVQVGTGTNWNSVSAGNLHCLAIKTDGMLWSWGYNEYGQLGNGTTTVSKIPVQIGTASWQSVGAGAFISSGVRADGKLYTWGFNEAGGLGDGTKISKKIPTLIGNATWRLGSQSPDFGVGIQEDGSLWTWGNNQFGMLGDGTHTSTVVPGVLPGTLFFCTPSTVADLTAGGTNIQWYASSSSTNVLSPTVSLVHGAHYYATQTVGACESKSRLDVSVSLISGPPSSPSGSSSQTFCGAPTISDLSADGVNLKWYAASTGGAPLAPAAALTNGMTYFASQSLGDCESDDRLSVTVSISANTTPAPTGSGTQQLCTVGKVQDLVAVGSAIKWYSDASGGTPLEGSTPLVAGAHYYATQTIGTCESLTRLDVVVSSVPAPTGNAVQKYCLATTLQALEVSGTSIKWYATSSGGSPLNVEADLVNGAHYYASQTINACESLTRLDVTAIVNVTPPPTGSGSQLFCAPGTIADLDVTGTDVKWYNHFSEGSQIPESTPLQSFTTYFATQTLNDCESRERLYVLVTFNIMDPPSGNPFQAFCGEATIADLFVIDPGLKWYTQPTGGIPVPVSTPLEDGHHYYASQNSETCESEGRLDITATVTPFPDPPIGESPQVLQQGQLIWDIVVVGTSINWYASVEDAVAHVNSLDFQMPLTANTTYYATQQKMDCESLTPLAVEIISITGTEPDEAHLQYSPNPVKDELTVSLESVMESVSVINAFGQQVINENVGARNITIDFAALESGVYMIRVQLKTKAILFKVVKE